MQVKYTWAEATISYDVKVLKYGNVVEVKHYSKTLHRVKNGMELIKTDKIPHTEKTSLKEVKNKLIRQDSLNRSFQKLIEYTEENKAVLNTFITLTFKENIVDLNNANYEFKKWIRQVKRIHPELIYICVPEFQKRGAVHYHLLTNLACNSELIPRRPIKKLYNKETKKWTELDYYDLKYWRHGFSSAFDIKNDTDSNFKVASYISKYFWKDIDNRLFGRQKILVSKGLKKGKEKLLMKDSEDYDFIMAELMKYKKTKEKDIQSLKKYVPSMNIKQFDLTSKL